MQYSSQVADRLKELISAEGISQEKFFLRMRDCGYQGSMQKIKSWLLNSGNRIRINLDDLPTIAKALDVEIIDLLP